MRLTIDIDENKQYTDKELSSILSEKIETTKLINEYYQKRESEKPKKTKMQSEIEKRIAKYKRG